MLRRVLVHTRGLDVQRRAADYAQGTWWPWLPPAHFPPARQEALPHFHSPGRRCAEDSALRAVLPESSSPLSGRRPVSRSPTRASHVEPAPGTACPALQLADALMASGLSNVTSPFLQNFLAALRRGGAG